MEHKELSSKIITVKHKRLGIIFIFLVFFKFKKKNDNDIATDMTQPEHSNIKCYASTFSNIYRYRL